MSTMIKYRFITICLLMMMVSITTAQEAAGGGAYIINNGKLINSIVKDNYALSGFGVAGTSGEIINSTIIDNQYLNTAIVNPGDMYLNDGKVFSPEYDGSGNLIFPEGYDASDIVGVCFWSNTNNNYLDGKFWVISVDETSTPWCPNGMTGGQGYNPIDIDSLYNYPNADVALMDFDGMRNTKFIVTEPGFIENPTASYALTTSNCAAKYCYEYMRQPEKAAVWFLPSLGQLRALEKELTKVNEVLTKLGKSIISDWFWSSNEYERQQAWQYNFPITSNQPYRGMKNANAKVRAMSIVAINKK